MTRIPARDQEQGLPPRHQFAPLDTLVQSRAPTDANSQTTEPYLPSPEDSARHCTEQPGIAYDGQVAVEAERQAAVAAYEKANK